MLRLVWSRQGQTLDYKYWTSLFLATKGRWDCTLWTSLRSTIALLAGVNCKVKYAVNGSKNDGVCLMF